MKHLLAALAAVALLTACTSSGIGTGTSDTAAAPVIAESTSAAPALSMSEQMRAWFDVVDTDFTAMQTDEGDIAKAATDLDVARLQTVCRRFKRDVVHFEGDPAAPDPPARRYLANAMDHYSTAASACLRGTMSGYATSGRESNAGSRWMNRATGRINALHAGG